jgi:hypothetical protein
VAPHQQESTHFSMERGMRTINWLQGFFLHQRILSAVNSVEFVSDRMSYIIVTGRSFHILF